MTRFATYNLLNGGNIRPAPLEHDCSIEQVGLLSPLAPDVLTLQEATDWDHYDWYKLYALASELDMSVIGKARTQRGSQRLSPNWTVLLYRPSKLRLVTATADMGTGSLHHGAIRARLAPIDAPDHAFDQQILVYAVHASWTDGESRLAESRLFTDQAEGRTILMGDLNSGLPTDPEPDWSRIPRETWPQWRLVLYSGDYGPSDRRSIGHLLAADYVDPATHLRCEAPPTTGFETGAEPMTPDHILVGTQLAEQRRVMSYVTADTTEARQLSTHLPRYLDLVW